MSETITVVAHITAEPSWANRVHQALMRAVEDTQGEDGCISYRLYESTDTPNHWTMLELWRDEKALAGHFAGTPFKMLSAAIGGKADVQVLKLTPSAKPTNIETVQNPEFWLGYGLP